MSGRPVRIVEVGPRDGLQNDAHTYSAEARACFVDALARAGLEDIEVGSFVNPKVVPQMADTAAVFDLIDERLPGRRIALVPNEAGYVRAREAGVTAVAVFASASEAFSEANLQTSIEGSFERFAPIVNRVREDGIWLRGYVSVAFGCPYSGAVAPESVRDVTRRLIELGCAEVSIADTIGIATPDDVRRVLEIVLAGIPADRLAMHFHDTRGQALANVDAGIESGVLSFDSAAGGMGGCPFAPGAPGNLATEALVRHLEDRGYATGIDPDRVAASLRRLQIVHH